MILTAFHGFCMALADSVPGVSGGTIAFIPFIAAAERTALKKLRGAPFALLGMAVVVGLTLLRGSSALGSVSFASLSPLSLLYIFLSGAVAITAMVLPGILGSSILLTAGVYLPAIQAVRSFLHMELSVLPGLFALGFGVLAGVALSIHAIRTALHKYRSEMVWLILGLMLGSLYAIVYGAVNLTVPLPPMSLVTFDAPAPLLGLDSSVRLLIADPTDYSFPSGHTLSSVIGATILTKTDRCFDYAAIPLAALIAFSRLYLYVHFPSDVLAAAVLGVMIGELAFYADRRWTERRGT